MNGPSSPLSTFYDAYQQVNSPNQSRLEHRSGCRSKLSDSRSGLSQNASFACRHHRKSSLIEPPSQSPPPAQVNDCESRTGLMSSDSEAYERDSAGGRRQGSTHGGSLAKLDGPTLKDYLFFCSGTYTSPDNNSRLWEEEQQPEQQPEQQERQQQEPSPPTDRGNGSTAVAVAAPVSPLPTRSQPTTVAVPCAHGVQDALSANEQDECSAVFSASYHTSTSSHTQGMPKLVSRKSSSAGNGGSARHARQQRRRGRVPRLCCVHSPHSKDSSCPRSAGVVFDLRSHSASRSSPPPVSAGPPNAISPARGPPNSAHSGGSNRHDTPLCPLSPSAKPLTAVRVEEAAVQGESPTTALEPRAWGRFAGTSSDSSDDDDGSNTLGEREARTGAALPSSSSFSESHGLITLVEVSESELEEEDGFVSASVVGSVKDGGESKEEQVFLLTYPPAASMRFKSCKKPSGVEQQANSSRHPMSSSPRLTIPSMMSGEEDLLMGSRLKLRAPHFQEMPLLVPLSLQQSKAHSGQDSDSETRKMDEGSCSDCLVVVPENAQQRREEWQRSELSAR